MAGPARVAVVAFPAMGALPSMIWPVILSLALNSLGHSHGVFAGVLCSGIVGGTVLPMVIGQAGDLFGPRAGMLLSYAAMGWILSVSFWAKPLVNNATMVGSQCVLCVEDEP